MAVSRKGSEIIVLIVQRCCGLSPLLHSWRGSTGDGSLNHMRHVLLFEDERGVVIGLRRALEVHGHCVSVTANLHSARQMLERREFDLIIVNILLRDATDVGKMAEERGIRIFLMTGSSSDSSRSRATAAEISCELLSEEAGRVLRNIMQNRS
jgi:DNA-binding NarL/FixJ family response regulator